MECDTSRVGVGGILTQEGRLIAYFSEKLCDSKRKYSTFDKEFYAIIRSLEHWSPFLLANGFILHFDHEALELFKANASLILAMPSGWSIFKLFTSPSSTNSGRGTYFFFQLDACVIGFEHLKSLYGEDKDFGGLFKECQRHRKGGFLAQEGYFYKRTWLCIPNCSTRELLVHEVLGGSLVGHFGEQKT